jgi:hypothetical protein
LATKEPTMTNDTLARVTQRDPTDQDWQEALHALANLAEKQGRMDLALRLAEAADSVGGFVPYDTTGGAR